MLALLRIGVFLMFLGRAYEHIRWIGPFRDIFYHPQGFGGWFASFIDKPLNEIYNDHFYENAINYFSDAIGILYFSAGIVILFYERLFKLKWLVYVASFFLLLTYFGYLYSKNLDQYGMFVEHAAQFILPFAFIWQYEKKEFRVHFWGSIAIVLTFIAHGLYAYGYYPQPGSFVDMMILGFKMNEETARFSLKIIGVLDFVFGGVVLLNLWILSGRKLHFSLVILLKFFLFYGIIWGGLTAFARIYITFHPEMMTHWLDQYLLEFLVRIPHFILPLVLYLKIKNK
jgi:hypothetical protein